MRILNFILLFYTSTDQVAPSWGSTLKLHILIFIFQMVPFYKGHEA